MIRAVAGRCGACGHFNNAGATLESAFPGMTTMGSGFASARASDGICTLHDVYLSDRAGCDRFEARAVRQG